MDQKDWDKYYEKQNETFLRNQQEQHDRLHHGIGAPASQIPATAGLLSVGFGGLLGAVFGIFVFQDVVGAVASAVVGGLFFFVLRLAFAGGDFYRPAIVKYIAMGAVLGFLVNTGSALFLSFSINTIAAVVLGLVLGLAYYAFVGRHQA